MSIEKIIGVAGGVFFVVKGLAMLVWPVTHWGKPPRWWNRRLSQPGAPMSVRSVLLSGAALFLAGGAGLAQLFGLHEARYCSAPLLLLVPLLLLSGWRDALR
jgi:hypothetical protein